MKEVTKEARTLAEASELMYAEGTSTHQFPLISQEVVEDG